MLLEDEFQLRILDVTPGDDSFSLRWSIEPESYLSTISNYTIELRPNSEGGSPQVALIPLNCTVRNGGEVTFDSSKCSGYLNIYSCSSYSVRVKASLICTESETQYSSAENFNTLPRTYSNFLLFYAYKS